MFPVSLILAPTTPFKTLKPQPYTGAPLEPTKAVQQPTTTAPLLVAQHRDAEQTQRFLSSLLVAMNTLTLKAD